MLATLSFDNITQLEPKTDPLSFVQLDFSFSAFGDLPELVHVHVKGPSQSIAGAEYQFILDPPKRKYSVQVRLPAASFFDITLCPRPATGSVWDPTIDGIDWQLHCRTLPTFTTELRTEPTSRTSSPAPAPEFGSIESYQATLHEPGKIVIKWRQRDGYDKYHLIYLGLPERPGAKTDPPWTQIEIEDNRVFVLKPTFPRRTYRFKIQGCKGVVIGKDRCSGFSADRDFTVPENTHSLIAFLRLSHVRLALGLLSLGPVLRGGIRTMMHLK